MNPDFLKLRKQILANENILPRTESALDDFFGTFDEDFDIHEFLDDYIPDTFAVECITALMFLTDEALEDFSGIAADFLRNKVNDLCNYDPTIYVPIIPDTVDYYAYCVFSMILCGVKDGDEYCSELLIKLYQKYYKSEYKQLKRFRSLSLSELFSLSIREDFGGFFSAMARILTMCPLLDIDIEPDTKIVYRMTENFLNDFIKNYEDGRKEFKGYKQEAIDAAGDYISQLETMTNRQPYYADVNVFREYYRAISFTKSVLVSLGARQDFIKINASDYDRLDEIFFTTALLMKNENPDEELDLKDVMHFSVLKTVVTAFKEFFDGYADTIDEFLRPSSSTEKPLVNIKPVKQSDQAANIDKNRAPAIQDAADNSKIMQSMYDEIEALRTRVNKQERTIFHLQTKLNAAERNIEEKTALLSSYEEEHAELIQLRSYLSGLSEEETEPEKDIEEMTEYLQSKKVVVVGGHSNWTYKLRNIFRKWVFIEPRVTPTIDGSVLLDADYIYFFTDTISHSTYGKYMKIIRSKSLPMGYIHSVNIKSNIAQIYKDFLG